jgi:hypothetical protein
MVECGNCLFMASSSYTVEKPKCAHRAGHTADITSDPGERDVITIEIIFDQ